MAVMRDRPYGNSNFLVDFGGGDSRSVNAGFAEVVFPPFDIDQPERPQAESTGDESVGAAVANRLILKRGVIGSLDLYAWWDEARRATAPQRRTVKIELLSEDQAKVVLTWRFRNVRPMRLSYSPLRAAEGGIVMETVELAFESMEMS
ncbi:MAG: phage tail protein [Burkholderiales bacterium]